MRKSIAGLVRSAGRVRGSVEQLIPSARFRGKRRASVVAVTTALKAASSWCPPSYAHGAGDLGGPEGDATSPSPVESWVEELGESSPNLTQMRGAFRLLYAQCRELEAQVTALLGTSPLSFALELSFARKTEPLDYALLAAAVRKRLTTLRKQDSMEFDAVRLSVEDDAGMRARHFTRLIRLLESLQVWQASKLFRYPMFEVNETLLQDFHEHCREHPKVFKRLSPEATFMFVALRSASASDEDFLEMLSWLAARYPKPPARADLREPSMAIGAVTHSHLKRRAALTPMRARSASGPLRVAVCVSGQLRGFREARKTWHHIGLDDPSIETDYFVHCWRAIGRRFPDPSIAHAPVRAFGDGRFTQAYLDCARRFGFEQMRAAYPSFFAAMEHAGVVDEGQLRAVYGKKAVVRIDDEGDALFSGLTNQEKMHYKIHAVSELLGDRASEYDLVLRIRPDKAFAPSTSSTNWPVLYETASQLPVVLCEDHPGRREDLTIGDQLGLGSPETMRAYSNVWKLKKHGKSFRRYGMRNDFMGHSTLAYTCLYAGIRARRWPGIKNARLRDIAPFEAPTLLEFLRRDIGDSVRGPMDALLLDALKGEKG